MMGFIWFYWWWSWIYFSGGKTFKIIIFLGREGYVVFTVGVGDPGGDGESKLNWLQ